MIRLKQKILLLLAFGCLAAQTHAATALLLKLKDGETTSFLLSKKPVISYSTNSFGAAQVKFIVYNEGTLLSWTYELSKVEEWTFSDNVSAIADVPADGCRFLVSDDGNSITVKGLAERSRITIHSIDGKQHPAQVSHSGDGTTLSLGSLSSGCYIINIDNHHTYKFIKK